MLSTIPESNGRPELYEAVIPMEQKDYDSCGPFVHDELSRLIPDPDLNIYSMVSTFLVIGARRVFSVRSSI